MDTFFGFFFLTHIPATLFIDSQIILPSQYFPQICKNLFQFWVVELDDKLLREKPTWFQSLIWVELLLQFPFFFYASYCCLISKKTRSRFYKYFGIIYALETATSMIPILTESLLHSNKNILLTAAYSPYLLIPLLYLIHLLRRSIKLKIK
eukprot:gb/GECH01008810.1/.p1 GENE.gb/GECH01008810.1/~~gb/GECH01008810.1/.p1  ORF type:complete len:151 (+),score=22.15 gb/GECH01008810.1/:1-453(+)